MHKCTFVSILLFASTFFAAAQEKQPEPPTVPETAKVEANKPKQPAGPAPTAGSNLEDEDPDAVSVIIGTKKMPYVENMAQEIRNLEDKAAYKSAVRNLLSPLMSSDEHISPIDPELKLGKKGPHLLIHSITVNDSGDSGKSTVRIVKSHWYIWREGIDFNEYKGTRLYGIGKLHVLAIIGPFTTPQASSDFKGIEYRALVKRKLPANLNNFLSILRISGVMGAQAAEETYLYGFGTLDQVALVSDITVGGYFRNKEDPAKLERVASKVTLDNEGYHWWDVSIGFPIKRVEDVEYNQSGDLLQSRQVDRAALLVLGDLFLRPVDIKNPGGAWAPAVAVGIGLQGKVRDNFFAGITTNLPAIKGWDWTRSGWYQLFRPFVGIQFINVSRPASNPAPGAPASVEKTVRKLSIGLNIPVLSTIERLVSKSSGSSAASSQSATGDRKSGAAGADTSKKQAAGKP